MGRWEGPVGLKEGCWVLVVRVRRLANTMELMMSLLKYLVQEEHFQLTLVLYPSLDLSAV